MFDVGRRADPGQLLLEPVDVVAPPSAARTSSCTAVSVRSYSRNSGSTSDGERDREARVEPLDDLADLAARARRSRTS